MNYSGGLVAVLALSTLVLSCDSAKRAPFARDIELRIGNSKVYLGYTNQSEAARQLGKPDEIQELPVGGTNFYWKDIILYKYAKPDLVLAFSKKLDRLVQAVYHPGDGDDYGALWGVGPNSSFGQIATIAKGHDRKTESSGPAALWIRYSEHGDPSYTISAGFGFDITGQISVVNYVIDNSWE